MSFCIECGAPLPEKAKFCPECGTRVPTAAPEETPGATAGTPAAPVAGLPEAPPVAPQPELPPGLRSKFEAARAQLRGDRREVVVLFADLKGYTALSERLDPEEVTLLVNPLLQRLAGAVYDYEGYVDKFIGDAVMALFGAPLAHENDAERAVLAGLAMLDVLADHNATSEIQLALRVGINLGEVVAAHLGSEMRLHYTVLGDTVNVASRLESAAEPNTVLVSEAVQRRIRDRFEEVELPPLTLKGKSEPIRAFRIVRYAGGPDLPALHRSPFAGREAELAQLGSFLGRAGEGRGGALVVSGEAGTGKSRLVAEGLQRTRLEAVTVAFSPIRLPGQRAPEVEIFDRFTAMGEGSVEDRARSLLGDLYESHRRGIKGLHRELDGATEGAPAEDPQAARQNRWAALSALLQASAARQRRALLFEDVHWADETGRVFIDFLVGALADRPLPILMTSRPGIEGDGLPEGVERLVLGPLDEAAAERLLGRRLEELPPEDRRELIRRSQGNPLFLEELAQGIEEAGGRTTSVPGTVQGLIMSRIDRLEPPLQLLLQMAAVLGMRFPTRLLSRMYALEAQPIRFDRALSQLRERGFLEERSPEEQGFRHALMQEVAHGGLLQRVRNVLHESAARLGEELFADRREAEAPFFAHHYWNAGLSTEAAPHLWIAGRAAAASYDLPTAESHLRRVAQVLEADPQVLADPEEWAVFGEVYGDVLVERGDLAEAEKWFERLEGRGRAEGRPAWTARGMERRGRVAWYRGELEAATRFHEQGLEVLDGEEDALAADLHNSLGVVHHYQGNADRAFEHTSRALRIHEGRGNRLGMAKCMLNIGNVFLDLREDLDSAERFYRDAHRTAESIGDRKMLYSALNNLGRVATERGEWREALEILEQAERILADIGWSFARYVTLQNRVDCEIALGRLADALRHLRICRDKGDSVLGPVNRVTTRIFLFDAWHRMHLDDLAREALDEASDILQQGGSGAAEIGHEVHLRSGRVLVAEGRWQEAAEAFARAERDARIVNPALAALAGAQGRRAAIRAGAQPEAGADVTLRSRPYSTLLRYLNADAEAVVHRSTDIAAELAGVADDAARMGILSLERAAAERLADVHGALGDRRAAEVAAARAARAMHALARNLPPEHRRAFLEHPRNARLEARLAGVETGDDASQRMADGRLPAAEGPA